YVIVHRKREDGYEVVQSTLPCLMAVEKEINEVSFASLPNMIRAARYEPHIWSVDDLENVDRSQLGLKGSPTIVSKVWAPPKPSEGEIISGTPEEQVERLIQLVLEKTDRLASKEVAQ